MRLVRRAKRGTGAVYASFVEWFIANGSELGQSLKKGIGVTCAGSTGSWYLAHVELFKIKQQYSADIVD